MDLEGYKNIITDGPPQEDGAYLVTLKDEVPMPRLFVRFTQPDGSRIWTSTNHGKINEDSIVLYKRILITPGNKA
jgi:hypothetical protein